MITVNMHEAKTRLSGLVKAVEEGHETVIICRAGVPAVELKAIQPSRGNCLTPNPDLKPTCVAPGFDPVGPVAAEDWPEAEWVVGDRSVLQCRRRR